MKMIYFTNTNEMEMSCEIFIPRLRHLIMRTWHLLTRYDESMFYFLTKNNFDEQ